MMKMIIRAVGNGALGSSGEVLAELDVKHEISQVIQVFLRAKLELAFSEIHDQEVVAVFI